MQMIKFVGKNLGHQHGFLVYRFVSLDIFHNCLLPKKEFYGSALQ